MLSIDEAIAQEIMFSKEDWYKRKEYHEQIAEWLEELKSIREMDLSIPQHFTKEQSDWIKAYCVRKNIEFYNKALDDCMLMIAEMLKAGDNNGT